MCICFCAYLHVCVCVCLRPYCSPSIQAWRAKQLLPGLGSAVGLPLHPSAFSGKGLLRSRLQQLPRHIRDQHPTYSAKELSARLKESPLLPHLPLLSPDLRQHTDPFSSQTTRDDQEKDDEKPAETNNGSANRLEENPWGKPWSDGLKDSVCRDWQASFPTHGEISFQ